ncbi:MAG: AAA family ATPase, partial [Prevotellaceae bacterium]|nr:AAA family ATPase [Prevotellaceae bacterium]
MQEKITIPYAISDFARLREDGYYYVDKTQFIPRIENYIAPTFLRPRRFGKSLYVSMLSYYYDINAADRFEQLFSGTYIGSNPTPEHNKYMVLRLDFSKLPVGDTMGEMETNFNNLVCPVLESFVRDKNMYARYFDGFRFIGEQNPSIMLNEILLYVAGKGLPRVYILIDEYDNATNQMVTAFKDTLYDNITTTDSFFRTFFKNIKAGLGEGTVRRCFCTGVLPITIDDLTSGYNIAEFLSLEPNFIDMMGFTHEEAAAYLHYVIDNYGGKNNSFEELWSLLIDNYDGYRFQPEAQPLFNPTILTYFFKKFTANQGTIPKELIDNNLRTDIGWMHRLTDTMENAHEMLNQLVADEELLYSD